MKLSSTLAITVASLSTIATAQTERELDSHVHGSATLNVAVDNTALIIELETPWNNLVGFEHAPHTDEQKALVDEALDVLNQSNEMFTLAGGDCTFDVLDMENSLSESSHDEHAEKHDDHDDEHDEKHDDHDDEHAEKHDDHDDEHADHDGEEGEDHSEVLVSYTYNCTDIASLKTITVDFIAIWPGFADIDSQLIGPGGQSLQELNADSSVLDITQVQ